VNPYLAIAALVGAGLQGVDDNLELGPAFVGNAYGADSARVPTTLAEATDLFDQSLVARAASVTRSSITTCTPRASRSTPSTRPSPTGSATEDSNVYEHTVGSQPATEEPVTKIELFDLEATDRAIALAASVATAWRDLTPARRAHLLRRFAQVVDEHVEELAQLEVANSGHTIGNARWEAGNVRNVLAYYSGAPERHSGKQIPVEGGVDLTFYEPLGVVGIIVPWNFPMPIAGWGFAPAWRLATPSS